ncbi:hypothetical protein [Emticicia agri]|uniref:Right handed beta helix domain-containing protein n=1 Tax=Emticicia agri TaxID=2492393 RepID=A0A4Q5M0H0_9BACT|nr:hypothetical protein [Emticicia agri]RYU95674.1 hypothetical protein EWM59_11210 [Emticicia agri]
MKKFLLLLFLLVTVSQLQATIRRVNNNPGVTLVANLVFANFTNAINAAAAGDTIYIEPSAINYGGLFINKRVVVIGPGYLLSKNPNTPFDKRSATVSNISFSTNSGSSKVYGLEVKGVNGNFDNISFSNSGSEINIEYCIFNEIVGSSTFLNNAVIANCFIVGNINQSNISMTNSLISNNIIFGSVQTSGNDNIIRNNIIFGGADYTSIYYNNIIYQNGTPALTFSSNINVYNNVCVGCTGTPANNNFFTTATNTIFVVAEPRTFDNLEDDNFVLHASSPAKARGVGGIDCGVFAGTRPYILSGIPPFPMITAFTQGAPSGGNIPITISIKRN